MITLLIARHGNTFDAGDILLRVGKRTNLPLSASGRTQAEKLGEFLLEKYPKIDHVFVSSLKRTQETAAIALAKTSIAAEINPIFDEIDYGVDDGKPETEVLARIGEEALCQWEENAVPPQGWLVNPEKIKQDWQNFAKKYETEKDTVILVVTSNGIARFALSLLDKEQPTTGLVASPKMRTGSISALRYTDEAWRVEYWDVR